MPPHYLWTQLPHRPFTEFPACQPALNFSDCQPPQSWWPIPQNRSYFSTYILLLQFLWRTLIQRGFSEVLCLDREELGLTLGLTLQAVLFHPNLLPAHWTDAGWVVVGGCSGRTSVLHFCPQWICSKQSAWSLA